jgi:hypothetical protein
LGTTPIVTDDYLHSPQTSVIGDVTTMGTNPVFGDMDQKRDDDPMFSSRVGEKYEKITQVHFPKRVMISW